MPPDVKKFANEWINSWNSHDIDGICSHYSDDFEITTPMIKVALGIDSGSLKGKGKVREYWLAALKKAPDLQFKLLDVAQSINSIAVYYKAVMNKMAIEVMFFDASGKVSKALVHYN
jgi:hypothetical protein